MTQCCLLHTPATSVTYALFEKWFSSLQSVNSMSLDLAQPMCSFINGFILRFKCIYQIFLYKIVWKNIAPIDVHIFWDWIKPKNYSIKKMLTRTFRIYLQYPRYKNYKDNKNVRSTVLYAHSLLIPSLKDFLKAQHLCIQLSQNFPL